MLGVRVERWFARLGAIALVALLGPLVAGVTSAAPSALPSQSGYKSYLPLIQKPFPNPFSYGANLSHPDNSHFVAEMGFGWVKYHLKWADCEPYAKGHYDWTDADPFPNDSYAGNYVRDTASGLKILMRVDTPPAWANGGAGSNAPPSDPRDFGDFMQALATFLRGKVAAYEIWNEPNLASEWGGRSPDPAAYTALLREAYRGVKAGDPSALVVTGGLATTGGDGGASALNDVEFIDRMYASGAKGNFDALGSHPYGFSSPPETEPWGQGILFFRRAEAQRSVMERWGDGMRKMWATEFGWLLNPSCDWPDRNWQKVPPEDQAGYLQRAYQYAFANWPWMEAMFVFNLDFSDLRDYWRPYCDPIRWYAIMDGQPSGLVAHPAYTALTAMSKPTGR